MRFVRVLLLSLILFSLPVQSGEIQPIKGAGPSIAIATLFFKHFSKTSAAKGYQFPVEQHSIKHSGGIGASGYYLFGRTGRPLNKQERGGNKRDIFLAGNPIAMVVGQGVGVGRVTQQQLADIFTRKITNWKEVGGSDHSIYVVGRERSEALYTVLKQDYSFFKQAKFDRIFTRDHSVIDFLKSDQGRYAISFGAQANFDRRHHLEVEGFSSVINLGLVYDIKNQEHPIVKAATNYARSDQWYRLLKKAGFQVPNE
jgi:hypothetical protein